MQLKVGRTYKTQSGGLVFISQKRHGDTERFDGAPMQLYDGIALETSDLDLSIFFENGHRLHSSRRGDPYLISEVSLDEVDAWLASLELERSR